MLSPHKWSLVAFGALSIRHPASSLPPVCLLPSLFRQFIAELQHKLCRPGSGQRKPIIARIDVKSGHGAGKPTAKVIQETSEIYAFIAAALGVTWKD